MSNRVTVAELRLVFDSQEPDSVLDAFIADANMLVDEVLVPLNELSDGRLTIIEKYLACHLLATKDRPTQASKHHTDLVIHYQGKTGMGLESTYYGQQVLMYDSTGKLAELSQPTKERNVKRASLYVV